MIILIPTLSYPLSLLYIRKCCFNVFNCRQLALYVFRHELRQLIFRDAYWLIGRFESILSHHIVLGLADKQTYRRVVRRLFLDMVDCTHIYAQLSQMFCFEFRNLQFYDDIAAQFQVIEKQIGIYRIFSYL